MDPSNKWLTNWTASNGANKGYCRWRGVTCDGDGAVTGLDVGCNDMSTSGVLPGAEVWRGLPRLKTLDVYTCGLSGPLPPILPASLEYMQLTFNRFTGSLPDAWSSMTTLRELKVRLRTGNHAAV